MINLSFFTVKLLIEFGYIMNQYRFFLKRCFIHSYFIVFHQKLWTKGKKRINSSLMEWFDDEEAVEEFDELYSIVTHIDEEDLSDLEEDLLSDLEDEEEDLDF